MIPPYFLSVYDFFCLFHYKNHGFPTGTAAVALSGLLATQKVINKPVSEHKILFLGAGEVSF